MTVRRILGNVDLRIGVKNALGDTRAFLFSGPNSVQVHNYNGDRTTWVQLSWSR